MMTFAGCKGLSILESQKKRNREEMPAVKYVKSYKERLRQTIDRVLPESQNYDTYAAYQKSRHKKEFRTEHTDEISQHEAAKKSLVLWVASQFRNLELKGSEYYTAGKTSILNKII